MEVAASVADFVRMLVEIIEDNGDMRKRVRMRVLCVIVVRCMATQRPCNETQLRKCMPLNDGPVTFDAGETV